MRLISGAVIPIHMNKQGNEGRKWQPNNQHEGVARVSKQLLVNSYTNAPITISELTIVSRSADALQHLTDFQFMSFLILVFIHNQMLGKRRGDVVLDPSQIVLKLIFLPFLLSLTTNIGSTS